MRELRKFLSLFLFTALMLVKVSAFHVYMHDHCEDEKTEECSTCDLAMEAQSSVSLSTTQPTVALPTVLLVNCVVFEFAELVFDKGSSDKLFSRPPPFLLV